MKDMKLKCSYLNARVLNDFEMKFKINKSKE
jgi:hypothetical protein